MFYDAMNLNKVVLVGRLTQDPQLKTLASGQPVCTFGMATNRVWNDRQSSQKRQETEFHNIVLWQRLAEIASQYLKKGNIALIEGRLQTRSWQDAATGTKKYRTEIVADRLQLGPREASSFKPAPTTQQPPIEPPDPGPGPEPEPKAEAPQTPNKEEIPVIDQDREDEIDVDEIPF